MRVNVVVIGAAKNRLEPLVSITNHSPPVSTPYPTTGVAAHLLHARALQHSPLVCHQMSAMRSRRRCMQALVSMRKQSRKTQQQFPSRIPLHTYLL